MRKQLSESFAPDDAFMFDLGQNQMRSHSKKSVSFDEVCTLFKAAVGRCGLLLSYNVDIYFFPNLFFRNSHQIHQLRMM